MSLVALPAPGASEAGDEVTAVVDGGFEDLYRQYAARVEALAWRRLHDRHAAEDAVQETFLRAYRSFGRIDADRPVWPWLRTIATNVCVDMLRLRRHPDRDGSLNEDDELGPALPAKSDPGEVHLAAQRRRSIATALAAVNPRQRRVVILRDVEGWENEEVAQLEGITLDAVKSALKRGRQTFRSTYLALADRNGLLGGLLVGAGGVMGRFRRLALRFRAGTEASTGINAVAPLAQLLPLAIVATLAGGVIATQDQVRRAPAPLETRQAVPSSAVSVRDVSSDAVISRSGNTGASSAAFSPDAPGVPASGARVINPLGDRDDIDVTSALQRDEKRTMVVTRVVVDQVPGAPSREIEVWMDCGSITTGTLCDAAETGWSAAPDNPTP